MALTSIQLEAPTTKFSTISPFNRSRHSILGKLLFEKRNQSENLSVSEEDENAVTVFKKRSNVKT